MHVRYHTVHSNANLTINGSINVQVRTNIITIKQIKTKINKK